MISGRYTPATIYWFPRLEHGFGPRRELLAEAGKFSMATTNAADLDGDGLVDLVIGDTSGEVFLSRNIGSKKEPKFGARVPLKVGMQALKVSHKSDPLPVDFDGDGRIDLLVGDECGDVSFFKGLADGTFAPGVSLFSGLPVDPTDGYAKAKAKLSPYEVIHGYRLRLAVNDWNEDGKLDLLLGDCEAVEAKAGASDQQAPTVMGYVYVLLRK